MRLPLHCEKRVGTKDAEPAELFRTAGTKDEEPAELFRTVGTKDAVHISDKGRRKMPSIENYIKKEKVTLLANRYEDNWKMAKLSVRDFILELIFPEFCLNCQRLGPSLCANCYHGLNFYFQGQKQNILEENPDQIYFDQLQIMAQFRGPLKKLIKNLKYQNAKNIAPLLAKMLQRHLQIPHAEILTFVPLHPKKLKWRGYNQCQEIATTLGEISKIPVQNLLIKIVNNQAQAQIKEQKTRKERMRGVFIIPPQNLPIIKNKHILILDDVLTTGATLNEASRLLKLAGARKVDAIVLASKMD